MWDTCGIGIPRGLGGIHGILLLQKWEILENLLGPGATLLAYRASRFLEVSLQKSSPGATIGPYGPTAGRSETT